MDKGLKKFKTINSLNRNRMFIILALSVLFINASIHLFSFIGIAEKGLSTNYIFSSINVLENLDREKSIEYFKNESLNYYNLNNPEDLVKVPEEYSNLSEGTSNIRVGKYNIYYLHENLLIRYPTEIQFIAPFRNRVSYPIVFILFIMSVLVFFVVKDKEESLASAVNSDYNAVVKIINTDLNEQDFNTDGLITEEFNNIANHIVGYKEKILEQHEFEKKLRKEKLNEFAYMAHDIKTPLTIIKGYIELIAGASSEESTIVRKENADKQMNRISKYIDDMLIMLKLEVLDNENYEIFNCKKLTEYLEMEVEYFKEASARPIQININYAEMEENNIRIIYEYLERAVLNLLKNAVENTASSQKISINLELAENCYVIEVKDSGVGFPQHIIEEFHSDATKNNFSGFGLRFVKRVAELHNGNFEIKNSSGAVAKITLPIN